MLVDCALYEDGVRQNDEALPIEEAAQLRCEEDGFIWLGLQDPSAEEMLDVAKRFDLPPLAVEDAMQQHQRPKIDYDVPTLLGSVWGMNFRHMPELPWR